MRIVVVGMLDSVHVARWLKQFEGENLTFWLFPSSPHRRIHPEIVNLASAGQFNFVKGVQLLGAAAWLMDRLFNNRFRALFLDKLIYRVRPDFVHALELQNAGYLCMRLNSLYGDGCPRLIVTNYGSDIFWFKDRPSHKVKLRALLTRADFYSCECLRDVRLARDLGFTGKVLPVIPNSGGFTRSQLLRPILAPNSRKVLAVKGYWGWAGRANVALKALASIADEVREFEIVVYSANFRTRLLARIVALRSGLNVRTLGKGTLSHDEMLALFASAKLYIGVSLTDGISTSLLEAMAMGAIPIQTKSACCDEWFTDTGIQIDSLETAFVAEKIRLGLNLAENPESARRNRETILRRAMSDEISKVAKTFYLA